MRVFWLIWGSVGRLRSGWRWLVKSGIFVLFAVGVLFPNPVLFGRQIYRYLHIETLMQADFPGMSTINAELDRGLPANASPQAEFLAVQEYVYRHIRYEYDWDNWGNLDYWPSAAQVWERQREDCDGRAILAASILRARGFHSATLMGNLHHIWVKVDQAELMEPDRESNLKRVGQKTVIQWPSLRMLLSSLAFYVEVFPTTRNVLLLWMGLALCYHPRTNWLTFINLILVGSLGFGGLQYWGHHALTTRTFTMNISFAAGCFGVCLAFGLAIWPLKTAWRPMLKHS